MSTLVWQSDEPSKHRSKRSFESSTALPAPVSQVLLLSEGDVVRMLYHEA